MKVYSKIIWALAVLFLTSCNDWLDLKPEMQATEEQLFSSGDGYRTVLNGLYKAMAKKELYGVELQFGMVDCMSQQYSLSRETNSSEMYLAAGKFDYQQVDLLASINTTWQTAYNIIANANNLVQNISKALPDLFLGKEMERRMIMGEAYACRALLHFDLLRLFAPAPGEGNDGGAYLPYVDTYPDIHAGRMAVVPFLDKVIEDLEQARSLVMDFDTTALGKGICASGKSRFLDQWEEGTDIFVDSRNVDNFYKSRGYRLNYYAITALLARVYQYAGKQQEAFDKAKEVIEFTVHGNSNQIYAMYSIDNFSGFQGQSDDDSKRDLKVMSNLIFAIYNEKAFEDYNLEQVFKKVSTGVMGANSWFVLKLYEPDIFKNGNGEDESESDVRKRWLTFTADRSHPLSAKWYCSSNIETRTDNVKILPIIRATEMRYIMAEKYARDGLYDEAYNILDKIRRARGCYTPIAGGQNWKDFVKELVRDARREWISEGQLFYLYKRLNADVDFDQNNVRPLKRVECLLPIPVNQR